METLTKSALTEMKEPETKERTVNTEEWAKWFKFKTGYYLPKQGGGKKYVEDKELVEMVRQGGFLIKDIKAGKRPRWLSLVGKSGNGKTYLAKKIYHWAKNSSYFRSGMDPAQNDIVYATDFCHWPDLADELQNNGGRQWLNQLSTSKFLLLDDIGAKRDGSGYITDALATLISQRVGKWTVITANLGLEEISELIDARVASRMIRDGSVVVDVGAPDYAMRDNEP